jgi:hypothetical protein
MPNELRRSGHDTVAGSEIKGSAPETGGLWGNGYVTFDRLAVSGPFGRKRPALAGARVRHTRLAESLSALQGRVRNGVDRARRAATKRAGRLTCRFVEPGTGAGPRRKNLLPTPVSASSPPVGHLHLSTGRGRVKCCSLRSRRQESGVRSQESGVGSRESGWVSRLGCASRKQESGVRIQCLATTHRRLIPDARLRARQRAL